MKLILTIIITNNVIHFYDHFMTLSICWPSQLGLENTPTASLQKGKTPSKCVLYITLNNQMVRIQ